MKRLLSAFLYCLFFSNAYSQTVITVKSAEGPLESVHLMVNHRIAALSDSLGRVLLPDLTLSDSLCFTHLLYEDVILFGPPNDSVITMMPKRFSLEESSIRSGNQWSVLKERLNDGLSVGGARKVNYTSHDIISKESKDFYYESKGSIIFTSPHNKPSVKVKTIILTNGTDMPNKEVQELKKWLSTTSATKIGNCLYFANAICRRKPMDGWLTDYLGSDGENELFRFYQPPHSLNENAKTKGVAYIDSSSGILKRIDVSLTPFNVHTTNQYTLSVYFKYFDSTNTILPIVIESVSYSLDEKMCVTMERKSSFSLQW
jgi:hypothetical protein